MDEGESILRRAQISHIFFADDLLLFSKANAKNCEAITTALGSFCDIAGQKVNKSKSKIFFSPIVSVQVKLDICQQLGIQATNNLGRYLGFPILHKGRNGNVYNFVIEKVQDKLTSWKARVLSPAGRRVLIDSASTPIVEYYMQCCALPVKVCQAVDKLHRDFLWGSTEEKRKLHLVNWNTVTLTRDRGGLGMVEMQSRNEAYLAKLCWRLANEQDAPWARVLMSKYFTDLRITEVGRKLPCSKTWVACKKGGPIFKSGLKWVIKNGASTNLGVTFGSLLAL